jgi:ferric-dicitrate binding protein FerR (iron transport regulator)
MNKELFMKLVTRYLSRETSIDETEHLNLLLKQKRYSTLFNAINEKWAKAGNRESYSEYNTERGLNLLTAKIRKYNTSFQWKKEVKQKYLFYSQPVYLRIAASFVALIILTASIFFISGILKQRSDSIAWNEKRTVMGEKIIVTLLDGTRITLNADSKLKYPVRFGEESREVYLDGEAYFEVTHDAHKSFVVHTGHVSTIDLGTKFNVKAFPNEENIIVSLEEGKVEVSTNESSVKKENAVLVPTQQLIYDKEKEASRIDTFDFQKVIGWKDNILIFDDQPLSDVLISLERYFGVKFEVVNQSLARRPIKANFRNESFWTVVKVIEKATGLTYTTIRENNELKKIVFYER